MSDTKRTVTEPHDRLTRIAQRTGERFEFDLERMPSDRCIVFVSNKDDEGLRGGTGLFNYGSDIDAITDLFLHLKAMFEASGKTLVLAPLRGGPDS